MKSIDKQEPLVELIDISKYYKAKSAKKLGLKSVSFKVNKGEICALVGPSGCGKSTLLKIISGIYTNYSGSLRFNGRTVANARGKQRISYVPQDPSLLACRDVLGNIKLPLEIMERTDKGVAEVIRLLKLKSYCQLYPHQLSGGLKQRVSLARAISTKPKLILMDEPFSSLDEMTRDDLNLLTLKLKDKTGVAIIFVTHNIEEAVFIADKVIVLSNAPATVAKQFDIKLPKARTLKLKSSPIFYKQLSQVRKYLSNHV